MNHPFFSEIPIQHEFFFLNLQPRRENEKQCLTVLQSRMFFYAQMAELVDALVSGTSIRKYVQVRVLFWAPKKTVHDR